MILITSGTLRVRTTAAMTAGSGSYGRASVICSKTDTISSRFSVVKVHKRRITTLLKATIATYKAKYRATNNKGKTAMKGLKRRH